jgi:tetratricopeptide (TPR) repeat protein
MNVDIGALWDHDQPAQSEQRFRDALATAQGDDALNLRTQIARTYGLRGGFDDAHRELDAIEPLLAAAGPEPKVRALLERGRALRLSKQAQQARPLLIRAYEQAAAAKLEFLAADALHMVAAVETTLDGQLEWHRRTLEYARAHPKARNWEAAALNNMGVSLNDAGRHEEALAVVRDALAAYQRIGDARYIRIAHWMIANTLRRLHRIDEALAIQLALEAQFKAAGVTDPHVYEELALLYEKKGDATKTARYRELHLEASGS